MLRPLLDLCLNYESRPRFVLLVELRVPAGEGYAASVDEHVLDLSPYLERVTVSHNQVRSTSQGSDHRHSAAWGEPDVYQSCVFLEPGFENRHAGTRHGRVAFALGRMRWRTLRNGS